MLHCAGTFGDIHRLLIFCQEIGMIQNEFECFNEYADLDMRKRHVGAKRCFG